MSASLIFDISYSLSQLVTMDMDALAVAQVKTLVSSTSNLNP